MTVNEAIVAEGRVAYRVGLPINHPSSHFRDRDMSIDWANGWRWEREAHESRDPPCECQGCRRRRGQT